MPLTVFHDRRVQQDVVRGLGADAVHPRQRRSQPRRVPFRQNLEPPLYWMQRTRPNRRRAFTLK